MDSFEKKRKEKKSKNCRLWIVSFLSGTTLLGGELSGEGRDGGGGTETGRRAEEYLTIIYPLTGATLYFM